MGDYCEFVNMKDKRFDPGVLASWMTVSGLKDLAKSQIDRFIEIVKPIAPRCLALGCGNHESQLHKYSERDVYSEIMTHVKEAGGFKPEYQLGFGYSGWLQLRFTMSGVAHGKDANSNSATFVFNLHHGFVGGKLAGAKALEMQRWLWTHNADVVIFGHSHNTAIMPEAVESVDRNGNVLLQKRRGCFAGTFLRNNIAGATTYSEMRGYMPLPLGGVEITMRPRAKNRDDAIRITA